MGLKYRVSITGSLIFLVVMAILLSSATTASAQYPGPFGGFGGYGYQANLVRASIAFDPSIARKFATGAADNLYQLGQVGITALAQRVSRTGQPGMYGQTGYIKVEAPDNAKVYFDDEYVGTGKDVSRRRHRFPVEQGSVYVKVVVDEETIFAEDVAIRFKRTVKVHATS